MRVYAMASGILVYMHASMFANMHGHVNNPLPEQAVVSLQRGLRSVHYIVSSLQKYL